MQPTPHRSRQLAGYLGAYTITMLGDRIAEIALPLAVLAATGNAAAAGAVAASVQLPGLLLALSLGRWTDRVPRRRMLVLADGVRALAFGGFALLAAGSVGDLAPWLALGAATGCGNVLFGVASQAILPQLTAGAGLGRVNALLEAGDATVTIVGPAGAGAVLARVGAAWGLAGNAVTFLVSALLLRTTVPRLEVTRGSRGPARPATGGAGFVPGIVEPLALLLRDGRQRRLQIAVVALSAHGATVVLALIVLGREELRLSVPQIGLVVAAAGVGGLAVSLLAARFPRRLDTMRLVGASLALSGVAALLVAASPSLPWALVANGLLDACVTAGFIATTTTRQARTPNDLLGRIAAASAVTLALARVAATAGAGLLLATAGARVTLAVDAALLLAAAAGSLRHDTPSPGR